jgi:His-Xaa-Ser system radical SAM maturase HxsC
MLKINGEVCNKFNEIYGVITTEKVPLYRRSNKILVTDSISNDILGYRAILTTSTPVNKFYLPIIVGNIDSCELSKIKHQDVVMINDTGEISILWYAQSQQNALLITESCNCKCLMCPQPPTKHNNCTVDICNNILNILKKRSISDICITGGEPTNIKSQFLQILKRCTKEHPESFLSVLTNGIKFSNIDFCNEILPFISPKIFFCVSLHSDVSEIHDNIVGREGAYTKTQAGIYNIAKFNFPIEIRFVINKLNFTRITEFADYIYRYFPFIRHVAFMSMELYGYAEQNLDEVWIDPIHYKEELRNAVLFLYRRGMNVSIYNTPLCLIDSDVHKFSAKSISLWKNYFIDICNECLKRDECCGLFTTSSHLLSTSISNFS